MDDMLFSAAGQEELKKIRMGLNCDENEN